MKVEQISIFLENKAGRLAEVTSILVDAGINIKALSLADTSEFGILRLIVDNCELAQSSLKERGFTVGRTGVVAVGVKHHPGGLNAILQILDKGGINVEYMYVYLLQGAEAILIFRFDRNELAVEILQQNSVHVLTSEEIFAG